MANRVYAGQRWWVEGHRSHIECLYRRQSRACPTLFIIAVAGGGTADRATGEEAEHWEEAETHNEEAVATTRLNATEGSSRATAGLTAEVDVNGPGTDKDSHHSPFAILHYFIVYP